MSAESTAPCPACNGAGFHCCRVCGQHGYCDEACEVSTPPLRPAPCWAVDETRRVRTELGRAYHEQLIRSPGRASYWGMAFTAAFYPSTWPPPGSAP